MNLVSISGSNNAKYLYSLINNSKDDLNIHTSFKDMLEFENNRLLAVRSFSDQIILHEEINVDNIDNEFGTFINYSLKFTPALYYNNDNLHYVFLYMYKEFSAKDNLQLVRSYSSVKYNIGNRYLKTDDFDVMIITDCDEDDEDYY